MIFFTVNQLYSFCLILFCGIKNKLARFLLYKQCATFGTISNNKYYKI